MNRKTCKKNITYCSPLSITAVYIFVSILWIVFSDKAALSIAEYSGLSLSKMQTLKGGFFVIATGIMIYLLVKNSLNNLKAGEHVYRALFESAGDGVFMLNESGIVDCNQQVLDLLGYTKIDELLGKQPWELSPPLQRDGRSSREAAEEKIKAALNSNPQIFEWQHMSSDGVIIEATISLSLADDRKKILVGIFHDVTEFKKIQEQLQQSLKMQAVGQLAGGVAHDFNNILNAVIGYAELALIEAKGKPPLSEYLDNIIKASFRASKLVSQILTFSRQGAEEKHVVLLTPIIKEVVDLLRATLPATVELKIFIENETLPVIADASRVHEVLMNLVSNAVSAMDEKGDLKIVLREEYNKAEKNGILGKLGAGFYSVIEVSDTGTGMDETAVSRIFEPFYTTKSLEKGTGLGLSVVYGIMQSHNGNIQLESRPGRGALFRLFFPKTEEKAQNEIKKEIMLHGKGERILFVDDEEVLAGLGEKLLVSLGYSVKSTTDSGEALRILKESIENYDLLITDQTMPNITGLELAEEIFKTSPDFPVILCTGYSSRVDENKAKKSGCRAFASKPLTRERLAKIIRSVLDGKE